MDTNQVDVTIQQKGTIITDVSQIKDMVKEFVKNTSGYNLSKISGVDKKIISKMVNEEDYDPQFETVLKLIPAMGKKLVSV